MFLIEEDMTIHITRGDIAYFTVSADNNGVNYVFQPGDIVRIKVFKKKDCSIVAFQKDFLVQEEAEKVNILLDERETKIGEVISKPVEYWYEIELNPFTEPKTIIGYDDDGAKIFKLYPEGKDIVAIAAEDVPIIDSKLSVTSQRPVENQAVTRAMLALQESTENAVDEVYRVKEQMDETVAQFDAMAAEKIIVFEGDLDEVAAAKSEDYDTTLAEKNAEKLVEFEASANTIANEKLAGFETVVDEVIGQKIVDADGVISEAIGEKIDAALEETTAFTEITSSINELETATSNNGTAIANIVNGTTKVGSAAAADSATSATNATTAEKIGTNAGAANTPVYFSGGKPVACTSLNLNTTGSSGSCTGNAATATKATQDGNGKNIASTYKTKAESRNVIISTTAPSDTTALWIS